jgi:hypothetical protein
MFSNIPYFEYQPPTRYNQGRGVIRLHGQVIFQIDDMKEFYASFGYTLEMARQGLSPDEFIWKSYFKPVGTNCSGCYQKRIVEYLLQHSPAFAANYGSQCGNWLNAYTAARASCNSTECIEPGK